MTIFQKKLGNMKFCLVQEKAVCGVTLKTCMEITKSNV